VHCAHPLVVLVVLGFPLHPTSARTVRPRPTLHRQPIRHVLHLLVVVVLILVVLVVIVAEEPAAAPARFAPLGRLQARVRARRTLAARRTRARAAPTAAEDGPAEVGEVVRAVAEAVERAARRGRWCGRARDEGVVRGGEALCWRGETDAVDLVEGRERDRVDGRGELKEELREGRARRSARFRWQGAESRAPDAPPSGPVRLLSEPAPPAARRRCSGRWARSTTSRSARARRREASR